MKQVSVTRIFLIAALTASSLFAARPFATDDAGTVTPGGFELELGTKVWQDDAALGTSFKHGLTDRMDLGVSFSYTVLPDSADGFKNAEMCFKFAILPDLFSTSFTAILGDLDYILNGIVIHMLGPFEIDVNLGYETTGMEGIEGTFMYALAIIYDFDKFAVGAEVTGDQEDAQSWLAGVRYSISHGFAVDGGITGGFQEDSDQTITGGIHYEF